MSPFSVIGRSLSKSWKSTIVTLCIVCSAVGLTSCTTSTRYPLESATIKARGLQPNEGYIVGTYKELSVDRQGGQGTHGGMCKVFVNGTGTLKGTQAELVPYVMPVNRAPNLSLGEYSSEVFAIPVPAGDYEISGWKIDGDVGLMIGDAPRSKLTVKNRLPMHVPFRVKAGEATYVGSYLAISVSGRNILNRPVFADGMILAKDQFAKDQARIAKYYPSIKSSSIRKSSAADTYMSEMKRIADVPRSFWELF